MNSIVGSNESFNRLLPPPNSSSFNQNQYAPDSLSTDQSPTSSQIKKALDKIKLFPLFKYDELKKFSVSYCLYLEFFHVPLRIFGFISLATIIPFIIYQVMLSSEEDEKEKDFLRAAFSSLWGVCAATLFLVLLKHEEKRLVNADFIHDSQWSEDQFSLLFDGIPRSCTVPELENRFRTMLGRGVNERLIWDVIYLQDYSHYEAVKAEIKKAKEAKQPVPGQVEGLMHRLNQVKGEYFYNKHYHGKAIIIFKSAGIRSLVYNEMSVGYLKKVVLFFFPCFSGKYSINGTRLIPQELPEPQNMLFLNVHYNKRKQLIATIISYWLSACAVIGVYWFLQWLQQKKEADKGKTLFNDFWGSAGTIAITLVMDFIMQYTYELAQKLVSYLSTLELQTRTLNYQIYKSLVLYVFMQASIGYSDKAALTMQLVKFGLVFLIKSSVKKIVAIYSANHAMNHASKKTQNKMVMSLLEKAKKAFIEFNFIKNISGSLPPLVMGMSFLTLNPMFILPAFFVVLLGMVVLDKYRMLRCNQFTSKNATFMLHPFKIYRYLFVTIFLIGFGIRAEDFKQGGEEFSKSSINNIAASFFSIGVLYALCCCQKEFHVRVTERSLEKKGVAQYEQVCNNFTSFFKTEDPMAKMVSGRDLEGQ